MSGQVCVGRPHRLGDGPVGSRDQHQRQYADPDGRPAEDRQDAGWRILGLAGVIIGGLLIYFGALAL